MCRWRRAKQQHIPSNSYGNEGQDVARPEWHSWASIFQAGSLKAFCLSTMHGDTAPRSMNNGCTAYAGAAAPGSSTYSVTAIETKAKTLLGLQWQYWLAVFSGLGGFLLLLYCTKNCCPFWSWFKTAVRIAWFLFKCGCKCGWCLLKMMPRGDTPESIRKEEVSFHLCSRLQLLPDPWLHHFAFHA